MKISTAIEILTQHQKGTDPIYLPDLPDAEKLGIEALKRCKTLAENSTLWAAKPLPGEDPE
ncbi:unnamed protein product [marine sediment metagenome]|uniref:Uncharacterized protein n=1 Tax=marine sediment metagenome TaxID=412755 RepID=X1RKI7_9ZZZZ